MALVSLPRLTLQQMVPAIDHPRLERQCVLQGRARVGCRVAQHRPGVDQIVAEEQPGEPVVGETRGHLLRQPDRRLQAVRHAGTGLDQQSLAVGELRTVGPHGGEQGSVHVRPPHAFAYQSRQ